MEQQWNKAEKYQDYYSYKAVQERSINREELSSSYNRMKYERCLMCLEEYSGDDKMHARNIFNNLGAQNCINFMHTSLQIMYKGRSLEEFVTPC
jgi:hypothetical protein